MVKHLAQSFAAVAVVVTSLAGCGGGSESSDPNTDSVTVTEEFADKSALGVSGGLTTRGLTVSWSAPLQNTDGTSATDLSGYLVRYGTDKTALSQSVQVSGADVTSVLIRHFTSGTYYFTVSAVTTGGVTGVASNIVKRKIP
jgi:hypothetical protein